MCIQKWHAECTKVRSTDQWSVLQTTVVSGNNIIKYDYFIAEYAGEVCAAVCR